MLSISKNQYVHIGTMFYQASFSIKPLLFKDILEFSSLNCKWDLGQPVGQHAPKYKSLFCWDSRSVWQHADTEAGNAGHSTRYILFMCAYSCIFYVPFSFCSLVQRKALNFTSLPAPTTLEELF